MKKIFTLLLAVGMLSLSQVQSGQRVDRDFSQRNDQRNDQRYDQNEFDKGYDKARFIKETDDFYGRDSRFISRFSMERKMKEWIASINLEYDYKIQKVKRSFFLSWYEKQRQIRMLENQRRWEISMVQAKFNSYRFDDRNNGRRHNGRF